MKKQELEQRLEQTIEYQEQLEAEVLGKLVGEEVVFETIHPKENIKAKLFGVGKNYLFMEDVHIYRELDLQDLRSDNKHFKRVSSDSNLHIEQPFGVYNKADISQLYKFK